MKRIGMYKTVVALVLGLWGGGLWAAPQATTSAAGGEKPQSALASAIEQSRAGNFAQSLKLLQEASTPQASEQLTRTLGQMEDFAARLALADAQRQKEYEATVVRVRRSLLAQAYLPQLAQAGVEKDLRQKVVDVVTTFNKSAISETIEGADSADVAKRQGESVKVLGDAAGKLRGSVELLKDDTSEYARTFRDIAGVLADQLDKYRSAWQAIDAQSPQGRLRGAEALRTLEDELGDALADVEAMISEKPWRVGLVQARIAKDLANGKVKVAEQDWYRTLKSEVEQRALQAVKDAQWYDAMNAYAGLAELEGDNEQYRKSVKTIRRHVRALGLYGQEKPKSDRPETKPAEAEPTWREMVAGVDADMVKSAISQMDEYYVAEVDYRKVARGALTSLEVLAETPQAARAFALLDNRELKDAFLSAVRKQMEIIAQRDRVDHMDLQLALVNVLRAADRTVKIPPEVVAMEFTEGMLDELDKFSSMIWPHDVDDFQKQTMGHFYGVGIQIGKEPGEPLKVVTPLPGSPAYKAGIKTGDLVLEVDGRATEPQSIDKLVRMITGEKGTTVKLKVKRTGVVAPMDFSLVRDEITIRTVKGWRILDDGEYDYMLDDQAKIGYLRITQFTRETPEDMVKALAELRRQGMRSLVLDLRFNPGGLLPKAGDVADEFLRKGRLVSTKGRSAPPSEINAQTDGSYLDGDLVVLVNRYSASAAEIVSGALKDWRRGIIVGERSYGKGSVQNIIPIRRHNAMLKLTTAYYYLPSGRCVHKADDATESAEWGVDPDVPMILTPKQTKRWLDLRRKSDLIQDIDPKAQQDDLAKQYDADLQLRAAVMLLKMMQLGPVASAQVAGQ